MLKFLYTVVVTISGLLVAGKYPFSSSNILIDLVLNVRHVFISSISIVAFGVAEVTVEQRRSLKILNFAIA